MDRATGSGGAGRRAKLVQGQSAAPGEGRRLSEETMRIIRKMGVAELTEAETDHLARLVADDVEHQTGFTALMLKESGWTMRNVARRSEAELDEAEYADAVDRLAEAMAR